ncbi:MAG: XRE family transcriptional regulator [SAR324 cluster bacterium]|nr:XRE family transcriptional regulator [SAR324 cluster bacterium]
MRSDNVPVIFGLKLKQYREERGYNLKVLSQKARLSPSYLNEIEKGKKYPKTDKILQIAAALDVPYDELVSLKLGKDLNPLESILDSPVIRELPLQLFGISQQDVIQLFTKAPTKAAALIRTVDEITRSYGMQVEHFFYAMLRSYQETRGNYFEDIEDAVQEFVTSHGWLQPMAIGYQQLAQVLAQQFNVVIDGNTIDDYPHLQGFRSIWVEGSPHVLLINSKLSTEQKIFQMGRELGYRLLGLKERGITSSRAEVTSFEQVLNDFKASYFAGAMLIGRESLVADMEEFFQRERWNGEAFLAIKQRYGVTPEMFLYRLTQIIPHHFHFDKYYFLRFSNPAGSQRYHLTKQFNMSPVLFPTGIEQTEHYCRRWLAVDILRELDDHQQRGVDHPPIAGAQVSHFINGENDYFVISLARPLALTPRTNTSVTLGFQITEEFEAKVKFWNDPAVPHKLINETCERCTLAAHACSERVAPPQPEKQPDYQDPRKSALKSFLAEYKGPR